MVKDESCVWVRRTHSAFGNIYITSCETDRIFSEEDINLKKIKICHHCGKKIKDDYNEAKI